LIFVKQPHFNFICTEPGNQHYVISVLSKPIDDKPCTYMALKTTHKGSEEFELVVGFDRNSPLEVTIERTLIKDGHNCVLVTETEFPKEFLTVEQKHTQKRTAMKLGVVYCKHGQSDPQVILTNGRGGGKCSPRFWSFVDSISVQIDLAAWQGYRGDMREPGFAYYDNWDSKVEVIYHVAPQLNAEETRRLIGNDVGYIIFLDEGWNTRFNPSQVGLFGEVPQVFAVVQPYKEMFRV